MPARKGFSCKWRASLLGILLSFGPELDKTVTCLLGNSLYLQNNCGSGGEGIDVFSSSQYEKEGNETKGGLEHRSLSPVLVENGSVHRESPPSTVAAVLAAV